jgi:serine/threonine protein kinase/tetratricopeptide (TPR) repeat protein
MPEKQPNLDSLFEAAVEIESAEERAAFLDASCGENHELRQEVENLLASDEQVGSFLEQPAPELEATFISKVRDGDLARSLDAGLAATFAEDAAVVIGNAGHSVLNVLGATIDMPRVVLRESQAEGDGPIARPKSPEMPTGNSDSRYQLQGEIARGGMGAILKGRDTDLGRDLAIKVLLDAHKDKPEVIQRFIEEAQIGGQLQHPGIAPIYELGQFSDKRPFFAMKLVKGQTLSKLLADREDAADERGKFIGIFEQVCQTMAYAHSRGVIHRDLKPANIMVGAFGEVQVMDWGLAKVLPAGGVADEKKSQMLKQGQSIIATLRSGVGSDSPPMFGSAGSHTQMGSVMGTPAYMPPEQALGEIDQMDERADVFGLGAILCEILTGHPPYVGTDGTQVYRMASRGKLDDAFSRLDACGADEDLIALTKHCLELDPKARPRNAGVLAERVTGYLESVESKLRETEVKRAAEAARAIEARKRMRVTLALAASVLLMFGLGGGGWVWIQQQAAERREIATTNVNSALSDAQVHQSLADSAELEMQVAKLDKAVSSAQQAVELAEQNEVEVSLSNRAKTMLAALQTRATKVRELSEQVRQDREFQEALELIRLSQADGGAQEITIEDSQDGRGALHDEGSEEPGEAQLVGGPPKKVIFQLFDISSAAKRYEDVFREAGLDLSTLDVSQAAALIRSSAIRESQIAAIDNWARAIPRPGPPSETAATELAAAETNLPEGDDEFTATDESTTNTVNNNDADTVALRQRLLAIANAADDSEWRRTVRAALEANDTTELKELAATDEARSQSPELIAWLGAALRDGEEAEASVGVLLQAQRQNPGDFWLNYELGKSFSKQDNHLEGLGFTRAALAIRPKSLGALMALAAASSSAKRYEDAAAIYRSVVKQNPRLVEAHTELASVATSLEQWDEAIAAYRAVLELEPQNVEVRASMGIAHRSAGHYQEAIETCQKAVELDPQSAYAYLCLGQVLTGFSRVSLYQYQIDQTAEQAFDRAIELDPTNARAYYYRGWLKFEVDDKRALADQRTAIRLDPNLGAAYAYLARFGDDEPDKRITYARKAVELDPSDAYAYAALSAALRKAGQLDESLSAGQAAISCDPKSAEIHTIVGLALEKLNRPDEALIEFRKAFECNPEHYWCSSVLGDFLVKRNEHLDEAVSCLTRTYNPDRQHLKWHYIWIHYNLRRVVALHAQQGELDRAAPIFRNILERRGNSTIAWSFLQSLVREFWSTEGLETYRKIAELAPESATAQRHLSRELQKEGLLEEAFVACRTAIELAPKSSAPYEQLASLFKAQEGVDDVAAYSKVLESYPNVATALNSFAWTLVTTPDAGGKYRHLDEAVQWAQSACDLNPESGAIWNTLAVAQYRRGQWQAAIDAIEKSQQLGYAEDPSNWLFLTMAHWQLGNREQAAAAYVRALSLRETAAADQQLHHFFTEARTLLGRAGLDLFLASAPENAELATDLAELLLESNDGEWTILTPIEMKSAGGATLTLLDDGSILASGTNVPRDRYHLKFVVPANIDLRSVRLEALTDPSLPANGPGRDTKGSFVLNQWQLTVSPQEGGEPRTLKFVAAVADYEYRDYPIRPDGWWSIDGRKSTSRVAIWQSAESQLLTRGTTLNLLLDFDRVERVTNLGRFRLSISDNSLACDLLTARKLTDPWAKLAAVYHVVGDQQQLDKLLAAHPEAKCSIDSLNGLSWLRDLRASGLAIKKGKQLPDDTWELDLEGATITDLAILTGPPISRLSLKKTAVSDLSPLRGWPLKHLNLEGTRVTDLTLLQEMPLEELVLTGLPISDLKPLSGLPISKLWLGNTAVSDLTPLRGMPLIALQLYNTRITDLSPLKGMPLDYLHASGTKVTDLAPLGGMPLTGLKLHACTELTDLSPLADCKELKGITLPPSATDIEFLRTLPKLERLSFKEDNRPGFNRPDKTTEEFWKDYDAKIKPPSIK